MNWLIFFLGFAFGSVCMLILEASPYSSYGSSMDYVVDAIKSVWGVFKGPSYAEKELKNAIEEYIMYTETQDPKHKANYLLHAKNVVGYGGDKEARSLRTRIERIKEFSESESFAINNRVWGSI